MFAMQFLLKPLYIFVLLGLVRKCNLFLCCRNSEQKMNDPSQSDFEHEINSFAVDTVSCVNCVWWVGWCVKSLENLLKVWEKPS